MPKNPLRENLPSSHSSTSLTGQETKRTAFYSETQINRKARHIIINWIDAQYGSIFLNNIVEIDEEKKRRTRNQRKSTLEYSIIVYMPSS